MNILFANEVATKIIKAHWFKIGFLNLGTIDIILCCGRGGRPVHCRMLSSIPGLYTLVAQVPPLQIGQPLSPDIVKRALGGTIA